MKRVIAIIGVVSLLGAGCALPGLGGRNNAEKPSTPVITPSSPPPEAPPNIPPPTPVQPESGMEY